MSLHHNLRAACWYQSTKLHTDTLQSMEAVYSSETVVLVYLTTQQP